MNDLVERVKRLQVEHCKPNVNKYDMPVQNGMAAKETPRKQSREKLRSVYPDIAGFIDAVEVEFGETTGIVKKKS